MSWERTKNVPMLPSSVFANGLILTCSEKGILTALDLASGDVKWEERLNGTFSASLVVAGGNAYALSESGEITVFEAGKEWKQISKNKLPGVFQATPAIANGRIYLRSDKKLYAIGE